MLSDAQKCKKVVAWSGDFGIDQVISWDLSPEETTLRSHLAKKKFEEFCKPQTNEVRARFDLLTSFRQGDRSVDEFYKETFFGFSSKMKSFVSRTINDSNLDLDKCPASKVRQLAKKLESSKSTAKYIKQASK